MHAFMIVAARRARLWCDYKRCTTSSPLPSSSTPASLSQCALLSTKPADCPARMLGQDSDPGHMAAQPVTSPVSSDERDVAPQPGQSCRRW